MAEVLDVEITKSIDLVHVGDEFLLYITIRNKFDQPLHEVSVSYDLPRGFVIRQADEYHHATEGQGWLQSVGTAMRNYLYTPSNQATVLGSKRSTSWEVNILPGEPYTITIPIRAGALIPPVLKPDTYHLIFEVEYIYQDQQHNQQARADLIIYPHVGGVYLGALLGGFVGIFLSNPTSSIAWPVDLLVGSVTGLVLAVVFRRKANVQTFIAVEDFWGGFLIGIVGGYGGPQALTMFLTPGAGSGS